MIGLKKIWTHGLISTCFMMTLPKEYQSALVKCLAYIQPAAIFNSFGMTCWDFCHGPIIAFQVWECLHPKQKQNGKARVWCKKLSFVLRLVTHHCKMTERQLNGECKALFVILGILYPTGDWFSIQKATYTSVDFGQIFSCCEMCHCLKLTHSSFSTPHHLIGVGKLHPRGYPCNVD